jgi:hypothetical protein
VNQLVMAADNSKLLGCRLRKVKRKTLSSRQDNQAKEMLALPFLVEILWRAHSRSRFSSERRFDRAQVSSPVIRFLHTSQSSESSK